MRYLANLRGNVPKDGLLLVSFAGHGIERGGRAFLLPSDAEGTDDIALLEDTGRSVFALTRSWHARMRALPAKALRSQRQLRNS